MRRAGSVSDRRAPPATPSGRSRSRLAKPVRPVPPVGIPMASTRLVVIEDEQAIRRGIADALRASGYEVCEAGDGVRGLEEAARAGVDLVLLDLMLPRRGGLDVLADLRRSRPALPVIILTARGSEDDRVRGLKMGADDYV